MSVNILLALKLGPNFLMFMYCFIYDLFLSTNNYFVVFPIL